MIDDNERREEKFRNFMLSESMHPFPVDWCKITWDEAWKSAKQPAQPEAVKLACDVYSQGEVARNVIPILRNTGKEPANMTAILDDIECECDEISNGETCKKCGPSPEHKMPHQPA